MAYLDNEKIDSNEKALASVTSKPDRLTGTTTQNKQVFDNLPDLIIQKYNQALTNIAEKETANNSAHTALGVRITNGIDSAVASASQAEASAVAAATSATSAEATVVEAEENLNNARKNIWTKYAVTSDGANMHDTPTTADYYIGIAVTTDNVEPVNTTDFEWSLFRGADGKGAGDMLKATYDSDNRGYVDRAIIADSLSDNQLEVIEEQIANARGCVVSASAPTNTNAMWIDISGTNAIPKYYDSTSSTWRTMSAVWG